MLRILVGMARILGSYPEGSVLRVIPEIVN